MEIVWISGVRVVVRKITIHRVIEHHGLAPQSFKKCSCYDTCGAVATVNGDTHGTLKLDTIGHSLYVICYGVVGTVKGGACRDFSGALHQGVQGEYIGAV